MKKYTNIILWFSFIVVLLFFVVLLTYQVGDEYVVTLLDNVTQNITPGLGVSVPMQNHIHSLPTIYRALPVPYDLGFVVAFLTVFIVSVVSAYKSKESSWFSFFGTITMSFMIFLFFSGWIISLKDWFVLNLIENFLGFDLATTPIFLYYITNIGIINLIWFVVLVLVNKLNFTFQRKDDSDNINIPGGNV